MVSSYGSRPSGWKPRLMGRQLRHEWNSCPFEDRGEMEFFRRA